MTIAAGFVHQDGILLCADTQQEIGMMKTHGSKLRTFEGGFGTVVFAFAGNTEFAMSAIEECGQALEQSSARDPLRVVKGVIDREYKRVVWAHPDQSLDVNVHYWLLFAMRPKGKQAKLYSSYQASVRPIRSMKCVGIGGQFGEHLLKTSFGTGLSERRVLHLAAYALATVKDHVISVGGSSYFTSVRHDGMVREIFLDPVVGQIEKHTSWYNLIAQQLFWAMTDVVGVNAKDFGKNLELFSTRVLDMRRQWEEEREEREREFRRLNPNYQGPNPLEI